MKQAKNHTKKDKEKFMFLLPFVGVGAAAGAVGGAVGWIFTKTRSVLINNKSDVSIKVQCLDPNNHKINWGPEIIIPKDNIGVVAEEKVYNNVRPDIRITYIFEDKILCTEIKKHEDIDVFGRSELTITGNYGETYRKRKEEIKAIIAKKNRLLEKCSEKEKKINEYINRLSSVREGLDNYSKKFDDIQEIQNQASEKIHEARELLRKVCFDEGDIGDMYSVWLAEILSKAFTGSTAHSKVFEKANGLLANIENNLNHALILINQLEDVKRGQIQLRKNELLIRVNELRSRINIIEEGINSGEVLSRPQVILQCNHFRLNAESELRKATTEINTADLHNYKIKFEQVQQHISQATDAYENAQRLFAQMQGAEHASNQNHDARGPRPGLFGSRVTPIATNEQVQTPRI